MNVEKQKSIWPVLFQILIFLGGFGLSVLVVLDAEYFNYVIKPGPVKISDQDLDVLRQAKRSILFVMANNCEQSGCVGTAFVFKPGYVATNKHVVTCQGKRPCGQIILKDIKGKDHPARLEAIKSGKDEKDDIAILSIADTSIEALPMADSAMYEVNHEGEKIVTIGFPLVDAGASSPDSPSFSAIGNIAKFDDQRMVFVSQGMDVNPGNSGGPVFLIETKEVLGIAVSVIRGGKIAGVERVIPINRLKNFFEEKIEE